MTEIDYRERLTQLVEPGERLLATARAEVAQGVLPSDPPQVERPTSTGGGGVSGALLNLLSPLLHFPVGDRIVDRIAYGVAGRGAAGSSASTLHHARRPVPPTTLQDTVLAVTDQRLLVCVSGPVQLWSSRVDDERAVAGTRVAWSAPRAVVADARVGWHRLNPKRLRIEFTDGSWLAFTVPIAEPGKPLREIASALAGH
ncbi:hypothetical protein [Micromonospora vulcania]|uniref:Uncharacterized protein n=1 Tax=Micromonospora vulcania TaxID=1441873 RepID=A0ABW1HFT5_9ACTN